MFYSLKAKFNALAVLLIFLFVCCYSILAFFLHAQSQSEILAQDAVFFEDKCNSIEMLFSEARFWEKAIILQKDAGAERSFGEKIERIRTTINLMHDKEPWPDAQSDWKHIEENINRYEELFNQLVQLGIQQSLTYTRLETNYKSMESSILNSDNTLLLSPLLTLNHFLAAYITSRNSTEYTALNFMAGSLENKLRSSNFEDVRMDGYLKDFNELLHKDHSIEMEIKSINAQISLLNDQLKQQFEKVSTVSSNFVHDRFQHTAAARDKLQTIFLILALLSILTLFVILFVLSKKVVQPIRSMSAIMKDVKSGNIESRFCTQNRKSDEIVQFGLSLNDMLDALERNNRKLITYQNELENRITELSERKSEQKRLTVQLQRAQKMEAIGALVGGVAHDLNNILSGLVSYPDLLLLELPEDSPHKKTVMTIQKSGQQAAAIVQDLLTLARRGVSTKEVVNLNDIVNSYLDSTGFNDLKSKHSKVDVRIQLNADLLNIEGSPVHLSKTVSNLILNAAEAIPDRGEIKITTENRYVDHYSPGYDDVGEGDYVILKIEDSGVGIPSEDFEKIFEPFFTRKTMDRSGTGLGMAVVWGTVKDHGGFINVDSIQDKGTLFTLYFPATRKEICKRENAISIDELKGNGEKILIVDDVQKQREIVSEMLDKLGYSVAITQSGEEAIEYLEKNSVDLLILDMIMNPGINGLETYRRVREIVPQQKAIIVSGYSEGKHVNEVQKLGAGGYLRKPIILEELAIAVKNELVPKNNGIHLKLNR